MKSNFIRLSLLSRLFYSIYLKKTVILRDHFVRNYEIDFNMMRHLFFQNLKCYSHIFVINFLWNQKQFYQFSYLNQEYVSAVKIDYSIYINKMVIFQAYFVRNLLWNGFCYDKTSLLLIISVLFRHVFVINFLLDEINFISFLTELRVLSLLSWLTILIYTLNIV